MRRLAIVLDIDGTLLSLACDNPAAMRACLRPHIEAFLDFIFEHCAAVALWTAGSRGWAEAFRAAVGSRPWAFVWANDRCSGYLKRLKKIWKNPRLRDKGFRPDTTLIVDDTPATCCDNYGNAIYIPSYCWGPDVCLVRLARYLALLMTNDLPIRTIEKRGWQQLRWPPANLLPPVFPWDASSSSRSKCKPLRRSFSERDDDDDADTVTTLALVQTTS